MKNFILRLLLKLVRVPKNPESGRILVVATTALGDTLWATPTLENLRRSFPNAYIAVLTSPIGLQILKHNPWTNRLFLFKGVFSLWKSLYQEKFDTVLLLHASQRLALPLCSLLGARRIVGTAGINKGLDDLLTDPLPNVYQHEIVRRLKIAERIGAHVETETLSFFLQPEERLPPRIGKWIAIHPGSKDGFKRWPAKQFAEVGRRFKALGFEILITGTKDETLLMKEVADAIPGAQIAEPSSLRSFAALLEQMALLISNDTGPVHLACALKRPVVAIYCSTDPTLCGPHRAPHTAALFKQPTCTPCIKRKCLSPFCFLQFTPTEVVQAALSILRFY